MQSPNFILHVEALKPMVVGQGRKLMNALKKNFLLHIAIGEAAYGFYK